MTVESHLPQISHSYEFPKLKDTTSSDELAEHYLSRMLAYALVLL